MTPPAASSISHGTRCPRCDYQIGVSNASQCPECGLAARDVLAIEAVRAECVRQRSSALACNIYASGGAVLLTAGLLGCMTGGDGTGFIGVSLLLSGAWAISLTLGLASIFAAPAHERTCWRVLWYRSHLYIVAPLGMLPFNLAIDSALADVPFVPMLILNGAVFAFCQVRAWRIRHRGRRELALTSTLVLWLLLTVQFLAIPILGLWQFLSFGID